MHACPALCFQSLSLPLSLTSCSFFYFPFPRSGFFLPKSLVLRLHIAKQQQRVLGVGTRGQRASGAPQEGVREGGGGTLVFLCGVVFWSILRQTFCLRLLALRPWWLWWLVRLLHQSPLVPGGSAHRLRRRPYPSTRSNPCGGAKTLVWSRGKSVVRLFLKKILPNSKQRFNRSQNTRQKKCYCLR